jgi:hypothetical protein
MLVSICCGCILEHRVVSRGASGVVIDSQSDSAISGATVAVADYSQDPPTFTNALKHIRKPVVVTDETGYFEIPPKQHWVLTIPIGDRWPPFGTLVVQRTGYVPLAEPITGVIPLASLSKRGVPEILLEAEPRDTSR